MTSKPPNNRRVFPRLKRNFVRLVSLVKNFLCNFFRLRNKRNSRRIFWLVLTPFLVCLVIFSLLVGSWWLLLDRPMLRSAENTPIDSILVLGGSITREIYVAELAKKYRGIPILISSGSLAPCIWLIFQQAKAPMQQVWLETCASSTFKNYYFAVPLLNQWGVHHLKIITSKTHLPRAKWVAQIILGSHDIWVEMDLVEEQGIPGNRETWLKTTLDVTRSLIWARISQYYSPKCSALQPLVDVNLSDWQKRGFKCEYQGNLPDTDPTHQSF